MSQRLDDAKTAPFTLGPAVTEAPVAALLLHGFTGSPWELRPVGEALAARGLHVVCPRLPGHGTTPEAMLWAGMREWLEAATAALESLAGARRVVVIGLSMGGLLAMVLAARYRTRVQGLVLMAPALRLKARDARALRRLRWLPGLDVKERWIEKKSTDIESNEVRAGAPILPRYPLARVFDLFALADLAHESERRITCPSLVIGAVNDHVVDTGAVLALQRRLPFSRRLLLQRGFHIIPRDTDRAVALTEIAHFVEGLSPSVPLGAGT
ncbi:MAG: alpha/beta fold hydrolase [Archangium sp.]|nr:alpha/beta fold hydrolase [Archangium sp.]